MLPLLAVLQPREGREGAFVCSVRGALRLGWCTAAGTALFGQAAPSAGGALPMPDFTSAHPFSLADGRRERGAPSPSEPVGQDVVRDGVCPPASPSTGHVAAAAILQLSEGLRDF